MALELEHERGKLTGLGQSNAALREHNSILETALAKREADLVQLNLQVFGPFAGGRRLAVGQVALGLARVALCSCPSRPQAECCPVTEMRNRGSGEASPQLYGVGRSWELLMPPLTEMWRHCAPSVSFLVGRGLPAQAGPTVR